MTDAASDQAHQDLTGAWIGEVDLLYDQRPAKLLEHSGADLHRILPPGGLAEWLWGSMTKTTTANPDPGGGVISPPNRSGQLLQHDLPTECTLQPESVAHDDGVPEATEGHAWLESGDAACEKSPLGIGMD
jgi:hypothetical protein